MEVEEELAPLGGKGGGKREGRWRRLARRRLPILQWAPLYSRLTALEDLVAGLTLGLTLVPQSIAYAALAGLPVQYGLYSSFAGTMLYVLFGTVKEVSIGPTSLMALLTLQATRGLPLAAVPLLALLAGVLVTVMGLLQLGFLVDLISPAVTSGFTSGTAVIILAAQLRSLLGLRGGPEGDAGWQLLWHAATHAKEARLNDCLLSLACCTALLALRKLKDVPARSEALRRTLWLLSIARNALVVCVAAFTARAMHDPSDPPFTLSGRVEPGLPPFGLALSAQRGNETMSVVELASELGWSVLVLPVVMVLANIAIAKAFSAGRSVDATQEMLALGLANMAGSLLHAMPTCGAFTRSAVSHSSGVRTPLAGLYSGLITLVALMFMTEYFYFIPKACLASVLVCAVVFMIDIATFVRLWRAERASAGVLALTATVCVLCSVELAVPVGAVAALAAMLRPLARPLVTVHHIRVASGGRAVRARPSPALVYLGAGHVAAQVTGAASPPLPLLLDLSRLVMLDHAGLETLERLVEKFKSADQLLIPYNATPQLLQQLEAALGADATPALRARNEAAALAAAALPAASEAVPLLAEPDKKPQQDPSQPT